jgi:glycosyltransferase involved in cell wall biosynthesis
MNENKIAFITCINDEDLYSKSLSYIKRLKVPESMEIEIIEMRSVKNITSGYNEAMKKSDSKYKVYLHQDVYIKNINFINDILNIFKDEKIGLIGMVGAKVIPTSGIWWEDPSKIGKVFDNSTGIMSLINLNEVDDPYTEVKGIDGLIMITQYDLPWRDDILDGWHFYDLSQSLEFIRKGFKVIVPSQKNAWCIHDCGFINLANGYEEDRTKFLDNYYKEIFPLVSILIPTYNQANYLEKALDSALNQTYKNTEIIICDDSTTNEVENLVRKYMTQSDKIKYFNNGGPLGTKGLLNAKKCFSLSSGEYISYLLHDDLYSPNKIEKMINRFLYDDTLSLVTSYRKLIDNNGDYLIDNFVNACQYLQDTQLTGEDAGRKLLFSTFNYIGELTTAIFKRNAVSSDIFNYGKHEIHCLFDISLWLKLLRNGNMLYISEPLSNFRIHDAQNTYDDSLTVWSAIDFFNMIISSYENKIFIKDKKELIECLTSWNKWYSGDLIKFSNLYHDKAKKDSEIIRLKYEYIRCFTKFINLLLS